MFFGDTCFWLHSQILQKAELYDFRNLIKKYEFGVTPQVREELLYHLPDYLQLNDFFVKPVSTEDLVEMIKIDPLLGDLDPADQSLFAVGKKYNDLILTDDHPLLAECLDFGIRAFHLADFSLLLVKNDVLTKRECYHILNTLLETQILKRQIHSRLRKELDLIH